MRTPKAIIADIKSNKNVEEADKMDFLMKTIRAVRSSTTNNPCFEPEELEKQRASVDTFSRLVTPVVGVVEEAFTIGDINCEWVKPKFAHRTDKLILYCHGGGYVSGGLGYARILATKIAHHTGIEVISFEYRLAPEHQYPAAIEDVMQVWNYLMNLGYGAKDLVIAGDSAGGNLSLELCLKLKEEGRFLPKAMILFSPWTDMRCCSGTYKTYKDKDPLLTYEYVIGARNAYAGSNADFESPLYSPLLANLENMPPALIQVGSNEILRDDSEGLAKNLRKHGSMAKLEVYQGGWHVFQQMPIPKASHALDSVKNYLDGVL